MFPPQLQKFLRKFFIPLGRFYVTEATFKTEPYRLHRLDAGPSSEIILGKEEALSLYEKMITIRKMESSTNRLYKAKIIRGFCHLYSGQEAVAVGVFANLKSSDAAITTYRNHAWTYLFDNSVDSVMAELVGVKSGNARGKGGSMHMYVKNFYGGNAIVGAQVPMGVGISLSFKYTNSDQLCVSIFGDGAVNSGQCYESFNMAKLWNLPCLFLCENNQYSMGTSLQRSSANLDLYTKGDVVPGIWADGMDLISMKEASRFVVDYIRSGKGPIMLEAHTYRFFGHSLSDPGTTYRTRDEVKQMRDQKDPIKLIRKRLLESGLLTENEINEADKKAKAVVNEAEKKALKDKPIEVKELTYDIYANEVIKEVRGVTPSRKWTHKYSGRALHPQ